jgi:hypothetical protein
MIKRLTKKSNVSDMVWFVDHENNDILCEPCEMDPHHSRLAIQKLAEYEDAEEQGVLHKTKVAIGQTVYTNLAMQGWYLRAKDCPYEAEVVFIGLNNSEKDGGGFFNVSYRGKVGCMMQFNFSDIGKTVFLTNVEAEKDLKEG